MESPIRKTGLPRTSGSASCAFSRKSLESSAMSSSDSRYLLRLAPDFYPRTPPLRPKPRWSIPIEQMPHSDSERAYDSSAHAVYSAYPWLIPCDSCTQNYKRSATAFGGPCLAGCLYE